MARNKIASVDGFGGGWIIAKADDWPVHAPVEFIPADDFSQVESGTRDCSFVVVDMPIGLPGDVIRRCDAEARVAFPILQKSIFRTPPRGTLIAKDVLEFRALHRAVAHGEEADFMAWGLVPKLRDVDDIMKHDPSLQSRIHEFHPELTWRHEVGRDLCSKKTGTGVLQRIEFLKETTPVWLGGNIHPNLPRRIAIHDFLDAVIGLSVAKHISTNAEPRRRFPAMRTDTDSEGLRMEIWY